MKTANCTYIPTSCRNTSTANSVIICCLSTDSEADTQYITIAA